MAVRKASTAAVKTDPMRPVIVDVETYKNYWMTGFKDVESGRYMFFEKSEFHELDRDHLYKMMRKYTTIGFNSLSYDVPMIFLAIEGATNAQLKQASDRIIMGGIKWWDVEHELGIRLPKLSHIDLFEPQPNPFISLKSLNGRLHGKKLQDLPFEPDRVLTREEMAATKAYNRNDLDATNVLYDAMREPLVMRELIGADIGLDLRSKSDTQVGAAILKKRIEDMTGERLGKPVIKPGATFRYQIPQYIEFHTPVLQAMLERIRNHDFIVKADGKVELPDFLANEPIPIGESVYQMGIGGLHSTEANRSLYSDDDYALVDADVASYYPAIILTLGLYPPAAGREFIPAYAGIRADRLAAKKAKDKTRDKGLKISLNGVFGLTSNLYSPFYSPPMTIAITLGGQLALLMLIERAERAGISVMSANTDGVLFRCPRDRYAGIEKDRLLPFQDGQDISFSLTLKEIAEQWEKDTGFDLEFAEYRSIHNQSVNSYFATKANGGHKRKGPLVHPWADHPDDADLRTQLMTNPSMAVCSDAALAYIKDGTPLYETVRTCRDIRDFVTVVKATGGATWRGEYLGKTVRYIWSTDGDPIFKQKAHAKTGNVPKVPKTEGCRPVMELPDEFPADIDYTRYVEEAKTILIELGVTEAPPPPPKLGRILKARTIPALAGWILADA